MGRKDFKFRLRVEHMLQIRVPYKSVCEGAMEMSSILEVPIVYRMTGIGCPAISSIMAGEIDSRGSPVGITQAMNSSK